MKKVKYVDGLGDVAEIIFKGSRTYRFNKGQELIIDDEAAEQLLATEQFVEVKEPAKKSAQAVKEDK